MISFILSLIFCFVLFFVRNMVLCYLGVRTLSVYLPPRRTSLGSAETIVSCNKWQSLCSLIS